MSKLLSAHAKLIGEGTFQGKLYDIGEYPGVMPSDSLNDKVQGQIFSISKGEELLPILDLYEGIADHIPEPHEYIRKSVDVQLKGRIRLKCEIYLYNHSTKNCIEIKSGSYQQYLETKL